MICQVKNMTKIGQKLTFSYSNQKIAFTMEKKEGKSRRVGISSKKNYEGIYP